MMAPSVPGRLEVKVDQAEKITIIEGPPPVFEAVTNSWLLGLIEGPYPGMVAMCRVRTANGPALVERCYRAWRDRLPMNLEYRLEDGTTAEAPIVAIRWVEVTEGHMLMLWVRLDDSQVEIEFGLDLDDSLDDAGDAGLDPLL